MIQVIGKALDIIELLAKDPEQVFTLSEIADTFHSNHGTCANILKTLVNRNYVEKVGGKKGYKLGYKAFALGGERDYNSRLINAAKPEMELLTEKYNENSLLTILRGNTRLAILRVNSQNHLQAVTPTEKEAYSSSTGRLLIAFLSPAERDEYIAKYGLPINAKNKVISKSAFINELDKIKMDGFVGHLPEDGILGLAVPVFKDEKVIASLSIYLPAVRSNSALQKRMIADLKKSANRIKHILQ